MAGTDRSTRADFYLPAFVLSAWGVTLLHTVVSGRLVTLIHPLFRPLVLVAGVLLLILSAAHLCFFRPSGAPLKNGWRSWAMPLLVSLFLTAPLLAAATYAPIGFSENALEARGLDSSSNPSDSAENDDDAKRLMHALEKLKPGEAIPIDLPDLATAATVPKLVQGLEGKNVRVSGQFHPIDASSFKVFRLLMFCCAADAVPLSVTIEGAPGQELKGTDWVEVEGPVHFVKDESKGEDALFPRIEPKMVKRIETPADPYVY